MTDFIETAVRKAHVLLKAEKRGDSVLRCTLHSDYGQMVRDIRLKESIDDAPNAGNLLYHFALVAQAIGCCDDLADWANEYGYDAADEAIKARYAQSCQDAKDLRTLLGGHAFENLMGGLDIHQAISNARPV